jgi:hypothetical protein
MIAGGAAMIAATILPHDGRAQAVDISPGTTMVVVEARPNIARPPVPAVRVPGTGAGERGGSSVSWSDLAHTIGGALVGGWLGYVGSQVARSDWEKETNGAFRSHRSLWAAAGALLGIAGSQAIGTTEAPVFLPEPLESFARERRAISEEEIRESRAADAYALVSRLRPEWLATRGAQSFLESALVVYLDDVRLGGIQQMRQVPTESLTGARFLDARAATQRYGMGHPHGAIVLSSTVPAR